MLSYQDSNLDKQNQNLMCYHYTIGQWIFYKNRLQNYDLFPTRQNLFSICLILKKMSLMECCYLLASFM